MLYQFDLKKAVTVLRQGGLVAFPTETVYGLGADASNPAALQKIFAAKQRPQDHPLIVHVSSVEELENWAVEIHADAMLLAAAFWPGPLTLILKKNPRVSNLLTGNQPTIAVRIPNHPIAQSLLRAFANGIAAPSANRFGRISPTTAAAVAEELGKNVDIILEGGQCEVGLESSIVDVSGQLPTLLRPGMITSTDIEAVLRKKISALQATSPRVSGSHVSHYAPRTPTRLVKFEAISQALAALSPDDFPIAVLTREYLGRALTGVEFINMPVEAHQYAHDLYATLRACDQNNFRRIIIETVPEQDKWDAIRDRLERATALNIR
jgi:L-threonylcarbamoyladenylate synthase